MQQQGSSRYPPQPVLPGGSIALNPSRYLLYRRMIEEYNVFNYMFQLTTHLRDSRTDDEDTLQLECLPEHFRSFYGPVDQEDPKFRLYLDEFKRSRDELWNFGYKLLQSLRETQTREPVEQILFERAEAILSNIKNTFSVTEIDSFDMNPYSNPLSVEHFILPRKPLSYDNVVHKTNASELSIEKLCANYNGMDEEKMFNTMSTRKFDGLGFFDPRFRGEKTEIVPAQIGRAFASNLTKVITRFPYGVTPSFVMGSIRESLGSDISWGMLGAQTLLDLLTALPDIFWVRYSSNLPAPLDKLLFPAGLRGSVCSVHTLLHRLWHKYLCMTAILGSPTPIEESWDLLTKFIGLDKDEFRLSLWGFPSTEAFVSYCIHYYDYKKLHIVVRSGTEDGKDTNSASILFVFHGLIPDMPSNFKRFGDEVEVPEVVVEIPVPTQTFMKNEDLRWVTDSISPGDTIKCRHGSSFRPNMFSLFLDDQVILKHSFQTQMSSHYEDDPERAADSLKITSEIPPDSVVAAFIHQKWRRALVVKKVSRSEYRIYLLESAGFADIRSCKLAPLAPQFRKCPALGILCRLDLGTLGVQDEAQRKFRLQSLNRISEGKKLTVKFLSYELILGHRFWTVEIETQLDIKKGGKEFLRYTADMNQTVVDHSYPLDFEFNEDTVIRNNADNGQRIKKRIPTVQVALVHPPRQL